MERSGKLWEGVLPGILRELYVERQTGMLTFTRQDERRSVRFRRGHIVSADTTVREDRMGDVLVRLGVLAQADLKRAAGFALRDNKRLGVVLMEMGLIDEGGLERALERHVHAVLSRVFSWSDGAYEFEEEPAGDAQPGDVTLRASTGDLILEATRSVQDPDVVRYNLGDIDRVLGLSTDPLLRFQRIALTPADGYVLSRVDGTLSAREVMQLIPLPSEDVQRSLFGLLSTGVVEFLADVPRKPTPPPPPPQPRKAAKKARAAAPAAAPAAPPPAAPLPVGPSPVETRRSEILEAHEGLRARTHYEILAISREATEAQVKEAYFRMAKRFHPDVHHDEALHDLRDKLEEVFIRLGEAYETLRNPTSRKRYETAFPPRRGVPRPEPPKPETPAIKPEPPDPAIDEQKAAQEFAKAQRLMGEEKYWDAIQILEEAIPRLEATASRRARVMLARAYMKNPKWRHRAEEVLGQVVREAPDAPEPYLVLGELYRGAQLRARAAAMYRKALQLSPRNEEALNALRAIDAEDQPPSGDSGAGNKARKR